MHAQLNKTCYMRSDHVPTLLSDTVEHTPTFRRDQLLDDYRDNGPGDRDISERSVSFNEVSAGFVNGSSWNYLFQVGEIGAIERPSMLSKGNNRTSPLPI